MLSRLRCPLCESERRISRSWRTTSCNGSRRKRKRISRKSPRARTKSSWSTAGRETYASLPMLSNGQVVLGDGPILAVHHLPARVIGGQPMNKIEELSYHEAINTYRRELIVSALAPPQGNTAAAAKALGLHRTHLLKI